MFQCLLRKVCKPSNTSLTVQQGTDTFLAPETLTPVHFFSHGSTMMLGEASESATYWKKCGDEALAHGIKGVIIMVRLSEFSYFSVSVRLDIC